MYCKPTGFKMFYGPFLQMLIFCGYPFNIQNKFSKNIQQQVKQLLQKQEHTEYKSKMWLIFSAWLYKLLYKCKYSGRNATKKFWFRNRTLKVV